MTTKRSAPSVHPSRHDQVPSEPSRKRRKPNIKAGSGAKSFKKAHPVNELKSRIRSLKRQLERNESLSAVAQQEKERALKAAEDELERNQQAKQRNDIIGRWHKVRFFDRRKAEKRVKKAKKELEGLEEEDERSLLLKQRVLDAEVDVKYAVYYPLEVDYVPLFPRRKKGTEDDEENGDDIAEVERKGDPVMWQTVKRCMAEGTLDALRNGRLTAAKTNEEEVDASYATKKRPKKAANGGRPDKAEESESEGDDAGGSFWE